MIQTKELMIGNWVSYKENPIEVGGITENSICFFENNIGVRKGVLLKPNEIEPIPITEELLQKCGFEHNEDCIWVNEHMVFHFFPGDMYLFLLCQRLENIEFIHELQNAYYFLTRKHLEINL